MGKITELRKANGEVLRIIDGEYVIGAGASCQNKVKCPTKIINGGYAVESCKTLHLIAYFPLYNDNLKDEYSEYVASYFYDVNDRRLIHFKSPYDYGIDSNNFYFSIKAKGYGVIGFGSVYGTNGVFLRIDDDRVKICNVKKCIFEHSLMIDVDKFNFIEWSSTYLVVNGVKNYFNCNDMLFNNINSPLAIYGVWDDWKGGGDEAWGYFYGELYEFKIGRTQ